MTLPNRVIAWDQPFGWSAQKLSDPHHVHWEWAVDTLDGRRTAPASSLEKSAQAWWNGLWNQIPTPPSNPRGTAHSWRRFFWIVAQRRQGIDSQQSALDLHTEVRRSGSASLRLEVAIELIRNDVFMGRYPLALEVLDEAIECAQEGSVALHTAFSTTLFLEICHQASGHFKEAQRCLALMQQLAERLPADRIHIQYLRRKASFLAEFERVHSAESFFDRHELLMNSAASPLQRVLHMRERLRLSIIRDDTADVTARLSEIQNLVSRHNISRDIFNIDEEICECELRTHLPNSATIALFETRLRSNRESRNDAATCLMHFLLARVRLQKGQLNSALDHVEAARDIAETWKYGRTRVRVLLLLGEILARLNERVSALVTVRVAYGLAKRMSLPVQTACAGFLVGLLDRGLPTFSNLFALYTTTRSLNEIRYHLSCCGLSPHPGARLTTTTGHELHENAFACVERMVSAGAVVFLPHESRLVRISGTTAQQFELPAELLALLQRLWGSPLDLEGIHALRFPRSPFDPLRHRARAASFLARCRKRLQPAGLDILFDSEALGYRLFGSELMVRLEPLGNECAPPSLTPLQRRILAALQCEVRSSGSRLCADLEISRQSLQRALKPLVKEGIVAALGTGKGMRYRLADRLGADAIPPSDDKTRHLG